LPYFDIRWLISYDENSDKTICFSGDQRFGISNAFFNSIMNQFAVWQYGKMFVEVFVLFKLILMSVNYRDPTVPPKTTPAWLMKDPEPNNVPDTEINR